MLYDRNLYFWEKLFEDRNTIVMNLGIDIWGDVCAPRTPPCRECPKLFSQTCCLAQQDSQCLPKYELSRHTDSN